MKTAYLLLLTAVAATTSLAAGASPFTTDEARAEAEKHNAIASHAVALRPLAPLGAEMDPVIDTDSAQRAAALANARQAHEAYLAEVLRAGAGFKPAPIRVTDTDSAGAAAAKTEREQELLADYADYATMQAKAERAPRGVSIR